MAISISIFNLLRCVSDGSCSKLCETNLTNWLWLRSKLLFGAATPVDVGWPVTIITSSSPALFGIFTYVHVINYLKWAQTFKCLKWNSLFSPILMILHYPPCLVQQCRMKMKIFHRVQVEYRPMDQLSLYQWASLQCHRHRHRYRHHFQFDWFQLIIQTKSGNEWQLFDFLSVFGYFQSIYDYLRENLPPWAFSNLDSCSICSSLVRIDSVKLYSLNFLMQ